MSLPQRKTYPKRSAPPKRRRATPRRSGRVRDEVYLDWIHGEMCRVARQSCSSEECDGPIEADHAGRRPMGRKADDSTCIPLCRKHHRERHAMSGYWFRDFDRDDMRRWLDDAIAETHDDYARWKTALDVPF